MRLPERLTWLGHATVLLELGGSRLLTDPLLRGRLLHLVRHTAAPDRAALRDLDAVLISHLHHDHLDLPSLRRLSRTTPLVAPRGAGRLLRRAGFADVTELVAGDRARVGHVEVTAVPAHHANARTPGGPVAEPLGYVVEGRHRVYFAGDTALFDGMVELATGGLDAALLPVWGWGPTLGAGHMDPREAARAAALLDPALAVPIHWGTYFPRGLAWRHGELLTDPPHRFAREVGHLAPRVAVRVLDPGDSVELGVRLPVA